jgi:hypothetical protein
MVAAPTAQITLIDERKIMAPTTCKLRFGIAAAALAGAFAMAVAQNAMASEDYFGDVRLIRSPISGTFD